MELVKSPLAPDAFPPLSTVAGIRCWTVEANIHYRNRNDLAVIAVDDGSQCAAVFTQSACRSAAVDWSKGVLERGKVNAIIINSGNANAFSGKEGVSSNQSLAAVAANFLKVPLEGVLTASTGVIGEPLPVERLTAAGNALCHSEPASMREVADAIRTTDTFAKGARTECTIDGTTVAIEGVAKGSGMIAPDMATMLAFVFTDAVIEAPVLQQALSEINEVTFNAITVDSDTSTSDSVILIATQKASNKVIKAAKGAAYKAFKQALSTVLLDLAQQIVRDGEGAQKFITVRVEGAVDNASARRVAFAIANSPLVKTAIAGEDANWGRIIMAVGKAGEPAERDRLAVAMGGVVIAKDGAAVEDYCEEKVSAHLKGKEIDIEVHLQLGSGNATVYTCDLTHAYIDINADYRS